MAEERKSWLRRRVEGALTTGFNRAYTTVRVDPDKFLLQLRAAEREKGMIIEQKTLPVSNEQ